MFFDYYERFALAIGPTKTAVERRAGFSSPDFFTTCEEKERPSETAV